MQLFSLIAMNQYSLCVACRREIERWSEMYPIVYRGSPHGRELLNKHEFFWPDAPAPLPRSAHSSNGNGNSGSTKQKRSQSQAQSQSNSQHQQQQQQQRSDSKMTAYFQPTAQQQPPGAPTN